MPRLRILLSLLLLLGACGPPTPPQPPAPETRAVRLAPSLWRHADADSAAGRLRQHVENLPADVGILLVPVGRAAADAAPPGFDPLAHALDAAHGGGRQILAALSAPDAGGDTGTNLARLGAVARHVATHYDIDGLWVDDNGDDGALAEALLVKPWLWIVTPGRSRPGVDPVRDILHADGSRLELGRLGAGRAVGLDLGAWRDIDRVTVLVDSVVRVAAVDSAGRVGLLLPGLPDTLRLVAHAATPMADTLALETRFWKPPFDYAVTADGTGVTRTPPWVELRSTPDSSTSRDVFEFLGRTDSTARAAINGVEQHVYATGVFFDSVALQPGMNRVRLEARFPSHRGGGLAVYEERIERVDEAPTPALPLWIDERSVEPGDSLALLADDIVRLSFRGSPGQSATARVGGIDIPFGRSDGTASATYEADLPLSRLQVGRSYHVEIRLRGTDGSRLTHRLDTPIEVRHPHDFPLIVTTAPESYVSWSLGPVRLGGPFVAEYPEGVVLRTNGRIGRHWRLRLGPDREAYLLDRYADVAPPGTVIPRYFLTSLSAASTDSTDVVWLPRPEPVPWVVESDPAGRRIVVTLHGVQTSSTWLSHRSGLRLVDQVTWRQLDSETYEATIHLTTERIWGFDVRPDGGSLAVILRHPPALRPTPEQPLKGLTVAIEAGHGGSNSGAIGLSGLLERDVNLATALVLGDLCREAGARVLQLREDVSGVPYMARRDSVRAWDADVFLSIHANAAGGGYLRHDGTSLFYKDPFWAPLATAIYDRMLELGFDEFGVVGSFNYRPTRMTSVPSVLVEQAFLSHAEDEEFLASPDGREAIARKVLQGLIDWLAQQPVTDDGLRLDSAP
jgi:N-acetylmuramoyl-L-alanine amidase